MNHKTPTNVLSQLHKQQHKQRKNKKHQQTYYHWLNKQQHKQNKNKRTITGRIKKNKIKTKTNVLSLVE